MSNRTIRRTRTPHIPQVPRRPIVFTGRSAPFLLTVYPACDDGRLQRDDVAGEAETSDHRQGQETGQMVPYEEKGTLMISSEKLKDMMESSRSTLKELMVEAGIPVPLGQGAYRTAPDDLRLLKLQLDRSEVLDAGSLKGFCASLPPDKQADFLGGVVLDNQFYDEPVRKEAMLMLIARSSECGESRGVLRKLGFSDARTDALGREVKALGPDLRLSDDEKSSMIRQGTVVVAAAACSYMGLLPFISGMPAPYQAFLWAAAALSVFAPSIRKLMRWASNPAVRREAAVQRSSDEVERYKSILLGGSGEEPAQRSGTEDPLLRNNLTTVGRVARLIASQIPFTRQRMIRRLERKVEMEVMADEMRRMYENERKALSGPSGDRS